jgi:hypothetical protein
MMPVSNLPAEAWLISLAFKYLGLMDSGFVPIHAL